MDITPSVCSYAYLVSTYLVYGNIYLLLLVFLRYGSLLREYCIILIVIIIIIRKWAQMALIQYITMMDIISMQHERPIQENLFFICPSSILKLMKMRSYYVVKNQLFLNGLPAVKINVFQIKAYNKRKKISPSPYIR